MTLKKRSNAQRSADRKTARTGHRHIVQAASDGGYEVVLVAAQAAKTANAPKKAEKAPAKAAKSIRAKLTARRAAAEASEAAEKNAKAPTGQRAAAEASAEAGNLPTPPDFTANTHKPYRAKLAKLVEMAEAGDANGLAAMAINPTSTSPRALIRYRDLAIRAITARG
jgi:hypothetical protein